MAGLANFMLRHGNNCCHSIKGPVLSFHRFLNVADLGLHA